jgi:hypothetical protein
VHDFSSGAWDGPPPTGYTIWHKIQGGSVWAWTHDTATFAVESIRRWGHSMGQSIDPRASRLLVTADAGGSHAPISNPRSCRNTAKSREELDHALPVLRGCGSGPKRRQWQFQWMSQKYICGAGCTKMIRASLGCPVPERQESVYAAG